MEAGKGIMYEVPRLKYEMFEKMPKERRTTPIYHRNAHWD